jgi:hypothetical protein
MVFCPWLDDKDREGLMKPFILMLAICLLLCACSPSESQVQTAIAHTLGAVTQTRVPPTATRTPTATSTSTPTFTSTPSPTPDIRILDIEPQHYLPKPEDLPIEANYYLPYSNWTSPHTNEEVISEWGVEKGREYVTRTGRVKGYWVYYLRGTRAVIAPEQVHCNIIRYRSADGAQLVTLDYNLVTREPMEGWVRVEQPLDLGDTNWVEYKKETLSGGDVWVTYYVRFSYRNIGVETFGYGLEKDVTHEFVENFARAVYAKLLQAPLSYPPTPTPTLVLATPTP